MRKAINTILATALIVGGIGWCWVWFTAPGGLEEVGPKLASIGFWAGALPAILGGLWLASDWFDL